jgi:hypothetical protein
LRPALILAGLRDLGFNGKQLFNAALRCGALLVPAIYDREKKAELVQALLDWALVEYPKRAAPHFAELRTQHLTQWVQHFLSIASGVAPMMKNPAFREEREWRLIWALAGLGQVEFLAKERGLSPYVPLHLGVAQTAANPRNPQRNPCARWLSTKSISSAAGFASRCAIKCRALAA